jgi:hypothetical protein
MGWLFASIKLQNVYQKKNKRAKYLYPASELVPGFFFCTLLKSINPGLEVIY